MKWIKYDISYKLPYKGNDFCDEDEFGQTGVTWFNTVATMLCDTDMVELLNDKNVFQSDNLKEKRM